MIKPIVNWFMDVLRKTERRTYSEILISRTSRGNANWFEKSGVREIEGGIKLLLIGRVFFYYE